MARAPAHTHTHNCRELWFQAVTSAAPFVQLRLEPSYVERSQPSLALPHWITLSFPLAASSWRQGDQTTPRAPWIASNDRRPAVQLWTCKVLCPSQCNLQCLLTDLTPILRQSCQSWLEKAQQQVESLGQKMSLRRSKGSKGVPWWQSGERVRL